jgi:hypothetical protein
MAIPCNDHTDDHPEKPEDTSESIDPTSLGAPAARERENCPRSCDRGNHLHNYDEPRLSKINTDNSLE